MATTKRNRGRRRSALPGSSTAGGTPATPSRIVGKVRRSHVASTFGPGAVVDMRAPGSGAPISGVVAGLEEWDRAAPAGQNGLLHPQQTSEPRLQRRLGVHGFRLPPVREDSDPTLNDILPLVRFPQWLVCPRPGCERLARADEFAHDPGRPERRCAACSGPTPDTRVYAVPVRFVVACENGHLDEFPWQAWIGCRCQRPRLHLRTDGAGLAGKRVCCVVAGCTSAPRSLEGAFGKDALRSRGISCRGHRPWLPAVPDAGCQATARVVQRGASSVYYSSVESALDIPPFSTDLGEVFGVYASDLAEVDPAEWETFIRLNRLEEKTGKPREVLLILLAEWFKALNADTADAPLEWAEYLQLVASERETVDGGQYQTRPEPVPPELQDHLGAVVLARRLREVRALAAFTRILPPTRAFRAPASRVGRLSLQTLDWLPAVELRGEGIFMRLSARALSEWETRPAVMERARVLASRRTFPDTDPREEQRKTSPRFLLLHSFAHAMMRQLSLNCGYSSAALRERLYVDAEPRDMAGVLIHTGSTDSEGTLGGLVRQGQQARLESTVRGLLAAMAWCSSDPLCITGAVTLSSPDNLSACHACLLAPETSCQHFNLLLDRAMLVGTPEAPEIGFFGQLLHEF